MLAACASETREEMPAELRGALDAAASAGEGVTDVYRTCVTRDGKEECFERRCLRNGNSESCETKGDPALEEGASPWEPASENSEFLQERLQAKAACLKGNLQECSTWTHQESQLGKDVVPELCRNKLFRCEHKSEPLKVRPFRRSCFMESELLLCDISAGKLYRSTTIRKK